METRTKTEFNAEVDTYLRNNHAVTVSTSSFTGLPHANTAPHVSDDERLYSSCATSRSCWAISSAAIVPPSRLTNMVRHGKSAGNCADSVAAAAPTNERPVQH